jgi:cbb3-type cytochrome oxidase subunit 3
MQTALTLVAGVVFFVAGIVWMLQGLGVIGGSVMSGVMLWAVVGPIVALGGLFLAVIWFRRRYRRSST